jgi:hypothetical protein
VNRLPAGWSSGRYGRGHMAATTIASALATALPVVTIGYVTACAVWPLGLCRRCGGAGKRRSPSVRTWRYCHRCKGQWRQYRASAAGPGTTSAARTAVAD